MIDQLEAGWRRRLAPLQAQKRVETLHQAIAQLKTLDGYPLSDLNRSLVSHSLAACGLGDIPVCLITGLPVDPVLQERRSERETDRREDRESFEASQLDRQGPGWRIGGQSVISETIAGFDHALIKRDGEFDMEIEAFITGCSVAVMDMGGRERIWLWSLNTAARYTRTAVALRTSGFSSC